MLRWTFLAAVVVVGLVGSVVAQQATPNDAEPASEWRQASDPLARPDQPMAAQAAEASAAVREPADRSGGDMVGPLAAQTVRRSVSRVGGNFDLPNDAGQVWREYDITAYTARVTSTKQPQQAIIDWILRETGYETWHGDPLGVLSANGRTLRVYHTPEMQKVVADLVERFVSSEAATYTFSLRLATLDSPTWRSVSQRWMRAVPVQTPGVNAWLLAKEDAAMLLGELRRRGDYREHSSPYLMVNNGQSTLVPAMRGRPYVRDLILRPDTATGFDPSPGQVDEGFNLDFSPLLSTDRRMIDATIKCEIDQVEKMIPIMVDLSTPILQRQRTKIEVPQMTHYRFHERFRWPVDDLLLIDLGMVALPAPVDGKPMVPGVPLPIGATPARADLLIFIECKGQAAAVVANPRAARSPQREAKNYRGRY